MSSVAFNYLSCVIELLFGREVLKTLRNQIHSIEGVEKKIKTEEQQKRFDLIKKEWSETFCCFIDT